MNCIRRVNPNPDEKMHTIRASPEGGWGGRPLRTQSLRGGGGGQIFLENYIY
ncbi:hypothetical protein HanIR_Chr17g0870811 [Helianthus annuus]|nr:hypothetical protein HanIR_Chr17g0870811 [Helianthus annuus]